MTTNPTRKTKKKGRANGDWKRVAASREALARSNREAPSYSHAGACVPGNREVGSAAYRRLLQAGRRRRGGS